MATAEQENLPVIDKFKRKAVGAKLLSMFEQAKKDRYNVEGQWLRNMRQHRGIYDPEVLRNIPEGQSEAYPKITRTKDIAMIARLMEMLFPKTDKNWDCMPSPVPDVEITDLQTILDGLEVASAQTQEPITDKVVEQAIMKFTVERAENMSKEIADILEEIAYEDMIRDVVASAVIYSVGVVIGPMIRTTKHRTWKRDPLTGKMTAIETERLRPYYEFEPCWNYYPDMSAKTIKSQTGFFLRRVMNRRQVEELTKRPDFFADVIKEYLKDHSVGNFKELWWEMQLRSSGDKSNVTDLGGRQYELASYWGSMSAHELRDCGVAIADEDMWRSFEANVWMLDGDVIKCVLNPLRVHGFPDERIRPDHVFVYEEDEISLLGNGLPQTLRDSQLAICETARMMLDNASVICGGMLELDIRKLAHGQDFDVYARKVWLRDDEDQNSEAPAVRDIQMNSHLAELQSVMELFMRMADQESALPPPSMGDVSGPGKEPYRTSSGMSMLLGAASLPIRDTVRNFDKFTQSLIGSLYYWLMQFSDRTDIRGDFSMVAKGSKSLIAKELRAASVDQFRTTLSPSEAIYIDDKKVLIERMRARDIPMELLADDAEVARRMQERQQAAEEQAKQVKSMALAELRATLAKAFKDMALARKADSSADSQVFETILNALATIGVENGQQPEGSGNKSAGGGASSGSSGSAA